MALVVGDLAKKPDHVPAVPVFTPRYSPLEFSLKADPPGGALPVIVHPAVFPVVRESEATRPELVWMIVADAAWAPIMAGPVAVVSARMIMIAESAVDK